MIKLNQNAENTVVLTLTESQTLTSPYYLFELTSVLTGKQELFNASNISTATSRYDMFQITLSGSTSEDVNNGVIYIPQNLNGFWDYKIYEATTQTLIASATTSTLEIGKCEVIGSATTIADVYEYDTTNIKGTSTYVYK